MNLGPARPLRGILSAAAALCLLVPAAPAQETDPDLPVPWLTEARLRATLGAGTQPGSDTAELRATYRFRPGLDTARLTAMRVEGGEVELLAVAAPGWRLDTLPGLLRLRVAPVPDSLALRWRVTGGGERLPLFVPETPTRPAESLVTLEVDGSAGRVDADRTFPRLQVAGDGSGRLVGRPENLPSFLRLPGREAGLTVDRIADGSVVLLVLLATGWWVWWRWAAARRRADSPDPSGAADRGGE